MHGIKCNIPANNIKKRVKAAFQHFKDNINKEKDIVLFAEDYLACKVKGYHVMALQHGIYWDIPNNRAKHNKLVFIKTLVTKTLDTIRFLRKSSNFDLMVCVDYNYVNWYRALMPCTKTKMVVIPNFASLYPDASKPDNIINIIFARRFVSFRGTRVFGTAIKKILNEYDNVHVTLAGWGPDESWLHENLDEFGNRVEYTTYKSEDSYKIHSNKHIAVIPTVGSEGTSLSLLEAMSSQCAVIGSDVGGITNIIVDGYNGIMTPASDEKRLYESIKYLIENPSERERIAGKGYETIKSAFSYDIWKTKWLRTIREYEAGWE